MPDNALTEPASTLHKKILLILYYLDASTNHEDVLNLSAPSMQFAVGIGVILLRYTTLAASHTPHKTAV